MSGLFPRTEVEGLSLSRMIIGTNWLAGWSHTSPSADKMIMERHATKETIVPMLETYLKYGVDTIMGPFGITPVIVEAIKEAEDLIKKGRDLGAKISLVHHSCAEQLVSKRNQTMDGLPDYLAMIRDAGMIPGLSAHMPELIVYSDLNGYDVQTYIQIYNCMGFLMQVEVETVNQIIHSAKKPVMTIKPMAAGRTTPFVGLNFSWATIRDCDMVTVGCFNEREVEEDIEISLAALEHRRVNLDKRSSPNTKQDAFGG